jgi:protein-disulfide isomerase
VSGTDRPDRPGDGGGSGGHSGGARGGGQGRGQGRRQGRGDGTHRGDGSGRGGHEGRQPDRAHDGKGQRDKPPQQPGSAREKLRQQQARNRSKGGGGNNNKLFVIIGVVLLIIAIVVIFVLVQNQRTTPTGTGDLPATVSKAGGPVSFGDGPVTVSLWEDFQCPVCKDFEAANGEMLEQKVDAGEITLEIHPLSFLDDNLGNTSSSLAANAFGCAATSEAQALPFHLTVYDNQPPEQPGTEAWTADDLVGWGNDVGITGDEWTSCVNDETYSAWVEDVQASSTDAGVTGTPTLFVDGKRVSDEEMATFFESSEPLTAVIDSAS